MTWIKLDDNVVGHPKIAALSDKAFREWIRSLCYASEYLTDGALPKYFLSTIRKRHQDELKTCGLWEQDASGAVKIHDYLTHQSSRDYVLQERDMKRRRSAFHRDDSLKEQIRQRDGDNCRYCARIVIWTDRRGPRGGTYDHVTPRGPETLDNLVVSCRDCNLRKGPRTPEQAGITLLQPRKNLGLTQNEPKPEIRDQITDTDNRGQRQQNGHAAAPLILSPLAYERRKQQCAFVGARLEVPHGLHGDLRKMLGGATAEQDLLAWYADLDEEIEGSGEAIAPDVFRWLKARYAKWAEATGDQANTVEAITARLEARRVAREAQRS